MWSSVKQNWSTARNSSSGVPTDVTFEVQERGGIYEVKAHKYYLALVSPVFKTHFFGPFGGDKDIVEIDAPVEAVKAMIDYIYLGQELGWERMNLEEMLEIACLADKYDVVGMMGTVKDYVEKLPISLDSVVETAHIADTYFFIGELSKPLLSKCTKFLSQVLCSHVLDFSGLFSNSEFASSAAMLHDLVLKVDLPDCLNCDHFPCLHGQLVPEDGWENDPDDPCLERGCLLTHEDGGHWTVFGYEPGDMLLNGGSEGEVVYFARKTTFTTDGKPHLHEDDDVQIILGADCGVTKFYFDCKKLGGAVPDVYLPKKDAMNMWDGDTTDTNTDSD